MQLISANIGNSSTKIAVKHNQPDSHWLLESVIRGVEPIDVDFLHVDVLKRPAFWSVCSVNRERQSRLADWVAANRPADLFHVIQADEVDLDANVESRELVGRDRLIAAWQALQLNGRGPLLVIDAGTAVTIDLVDENRVFQGGMIFPGAHACLDALAGKTDALPNLSADGPGQFKGQLELGLIGKSTESAIRLGVYQSQISVMKWAVMQLSQFHDPLTVYLTGGGIQELEIWLPDAWQHVPDLVLQGAFAIGKDILDRLIRKS